MHARALRVCDSTAASHRLPAPAKMPTLPPRSAARTQLLQYILRQESARGRGDGEGETAVR